MGGLDESGSPPFLPETDVSVSLSGISHPFEWLSQIQGQITYVFLTLLPLVFLAS